jgi:hypothetical protein
MIGDHQLGRNDGHCASRAHDSAKSLANRALAGAEARGEVAMVRMLLLGEA